MINKLEEWAWLIENGSPIFVEPAAVLSALRHEWTLTSWAMPKGTNGADRWIALNGDPMVSQDAAWKLLHTLYPQVKGRIIFGDDLYCVDLLIGREKVRGSGNSVALSIIAAILNHERTKI